MKNNKGITLIALVITIVVLIILAAVAINMTLGDDGIFQRAKTAAKQMSIESAKEKLETEKASASVRTKGQKVTLSDYVETVREDNIADDVAVASSGDYAVISINGYVFKIEEKDNGISIAYMGTSDGVPLESPAAEGVLSITLSKTGWTNENITATTTGSEEGYTVQMSTNGTTWTETNTLTITENTTVYACLYNGIRYGAATTEEVTNIDKQKPTTPSITNSSNGEQTNQDVTITVTSSDEGSGIAKYQVYYGGEWHDINETTNSITSTFTEDINETIRYKVIDNAGNESDEATTTIHIAKPSITTESGTIRTGSQNFTYTGAVQTATLTAGTYKLEVWGAQGGGVTYTSYYVGGKGGYSTGTLTITSNTVLYIYSGGKPTTYNSGGFNGGGSCTNGTSSYSNPGGGASDIRLGTDSLYARLIVAGGGGGAANGGTGSSYRATGGIGGGASGGNGYSQSYSAGRVGGGGTQTSGGQYGYWSGNSSGGSSGTFGQGGTTTYSCYAAGGGGGWYGGGSGNYCSAGGGSGWVFTAANYNTWQSGNSSDANQYALKDYTQYHLSDAQTIAGNTEFDAPGGGKETGHTGDGYARITIVE